MKTFVSRFAVVIVALCTLFACCSCSAGKYSPELKPATVTSPAVGGDGVLRVGVTLENAPYAADVSDKWVGLDVDLAAALADELGLRLELVDVGDDPVAALSASKVDVVMGLNTADTENGCWVSDPYISSGVALFANSASAGVPAAGSTSSIAARVSSMGSWQVSNQFPSANLIAEDKLEKAFADLSSGSADYVACDAVIGQYVASTANIAAVPVVMMESASGLSVGVATGNTDLSNAVQSALDALSSSGVVSVIERKWLGEAVDYSTLPKTANADGQTATEGTATDDAADTGTVGGNAVQIGSSGATAAGSGTATGATTSDATNYGTSTTEAVTGGAATTGTDTGTATTDTGTATTGTDVANTAAAAPTTVTQ